MSGEEGGAAQDAPQPAALLSALVTEHFVLQSAAGATISESGSRSSVYLAALSSCLVAIGFSSQEPALMQVLVSTLLPTLYVLGWFTVVRLVDTAVSSIVAQQRIEMIRAYYARLDAAASEFFQPDGSASGTLGVRYGARSLLFTAATMIAVVNAVLGGSAVAVICALGVGWQTAVVVSLGVAVGLLSLAASIVYQERRLAPLRSV
jgi:hypothetical protein